MASDLSLYTRLGGETAVEAAVVLFHRKVVGNAELAPFFQGYDIGDQMEKHIAFMMRVFGGPTVGQEPDLSTVHAKLVSRGLVGRHVDEFVRLLAEVLAELEVPSNDISEVLATMSASRASVLGGAGKPGGGGGGKSDGGTGGGGSAVAAFDQVVVEDGGTSRIFTPAEFLALPLGKRVTYVVQNQALFFRGAERVSADAALANARKLRVASLA